MFSLAGPDSNGSRYLQGLDLFLELDDRGGSATTDHRLGRVVQEQRRFDEAESHYQQALEAYRAAGDHHGASAVTTSLSRLLAKPDAIDAAASCHRVTHYVRNSA